jgi:hypothetical protein
MYLNIAPLIVNLKGFWVVVVVWRLFLAVAILVLVLLMWQCGMLEKVHLLSMWACPPGSQFIHNVSLLTFSLNIEKEKENVIGKTYVNVSL